MPCPRLIALLALAALSAECASLAEEKGNSVTVAVSGIAQARGQVHVDICPEKQFTREGCPWSATVRASTGTTVLRVDNVPPGRYAAQAYWDANANGKADRNLLGMPTELVGFSRDVKVGMARPRFADAAFDHGNAPTRIGLSVRKIP